MLDFIGIGAQKAGTTWVSGNLKNHPDVTFPGGKEVHFWNANYKNGIQWYKSLFTAEDGKKKGDITPAYGFLSVEKIKEVKANFPDLPIIYLVRDPFERAWSSALMALRRAELEIDEVSDQWFIDHFRSQGSIKRGDYEMCLRNWRGVYGEEAILVLQFEDIPLKPKELLDRICKHIGVDSAFFLNKPEAEFLHKHNEGSGHKLRAGLIPVLREIYREKLPSLRDYLGVDYTGLLT